MAEPKKALIERLFREHRDALQTFFSRRVRSKPEAPDLAQEVYLRLLRVRDTDAIRNPELYIYTVANNLVKERGALERRERNSVDITEETVQRELADLPRFDGDIDRDRHLRRMRDALAQLPPQWQAAVILQYRDGLTYQQIAAKLGISPHTVKKHLWRALEQCRRLMSRENLP